FPRPAAESDPAQGAALEWECATEIQRAKERRMQNPASKRAAGGVCGRPERRKRQAAASGNGWKGPTRGERSGIAARFARDCRGECFCANAFGRGQTGTQIRSRRQAQSAHCHGQRKNAENASRKTLSDRDGTKRVCAVDRGRRLVADGIAG